MDSKEIDTLAWHGIGLLRLGAEKWRILEETRHHGAYFSLTYPHEVARPMRKDLVTIIEIEDREEKLRLGIIRSKQAVSTLESRVVFDCIQFIHPSSLEELLNLSSETTRQGLRSKIPISDAPFHRVPNEIGRPLIEGISSISENIPALKHILAVLSKPHRFGNAQAMQHDAVSSALKIFGVAHNPAKVTFLGQDTALETLRLYEDSIIEHDARSIRDWNFISSHITGRALFEKGGEQLEVITANKRPLEKLFGADLIYFNRTQNSIVMLQYKMMQPTEERQEWIVRIDKQFKNELERMKRFDKDLDPNGPYRLNSGPFFIKLIKRDAKINASSIIISLGHLKQLVAVGDITGPKGGLRISYQKLDGHYLRGSSFVELVRSGYIGTRKATTDYLYALIEAILSEGHALVAAIQEGEKPNQISPQKLRQQIK